MNKVKFRIDGKRKEVSAKKLAKKFRKGKYFLLDGNYIENLQEMLKAEYKGETVKIRRKETILIVREIGRQNEEARIKQKDEIIKIRCAVLNKIKDISTRVSDELIKILEPFKGEKVYTVNDNFTVKFKKAMVDVPELHVDEDLMKGVKLTYETEKLWLMRSGNRIIVTLRFRYTVPWNDIHGEYTERIYLANLGEDKQTITDFKSADDWEKLDWEKEVKLIRKSEELERKLSEVNDQITVNKYF